MGADPSAATGGRDAGSLSAGVAMSGMGVEPVGGFDADIAACELSIPGIGAEPSDEVGGARRAGSSFCSAVFVAGAGADANGDGLSNTPDEVPVSAFTSLAGSDLLCAGLLSAVLLGAGLLVVAALAVACLTGDVAGLSAALAAASVGGSAVFFAAAAAGVATGFAVAGLGA